MLAINKMTDYILFNIGMIVHYFLNDIMDPSLAQVMQVLEAKCNKYANYFETTVEYLVCCMTNQQMSQHMNIAIVDQIVPTTCNLQEY